ncbi:hypothetical protein B9Z55_006598 [Caenorhabditis nigoni]|uniref:Uncharacterized protein n=1 Tax=Caenorhabditis nigoni TaxID=1611254 RepID=A0A2G5V5Y5_9PELO|nr:hypothetical protein B9Z55_006598 [Caenorhabditis nigoni]
MASFVMLLIVSYFPRLSQRSLHSHLLKPSYRPKKSFMDSSSQCALPSLLSSFSQCVGCSAVAFSTALHSQRVAALRCARQGSSHSSSRHYTPPSFYRTYIRIEEALLWPTDIHFSSLAQSPSPHSHTHIETYTEEGRPWQEA